LEVRILLDTNAYSAMRRGEAWAGSRVHTATEMILSTVVLGELLYGFRYGARYEDNVAKLEAFLALPAVSVMPVSKVTADHFGQVAAALRRKGRPIPSNDIWIAAHSIESNAELVSLNPHFG
jgi:tRNA(fMet)-specific endonuclease VapC